jgi:hypothetical protein
MAKNRLVLWAMGGALALAGCAGSMGSSGNTPAASAQAQWAQTPATGAQASAAAQQANASGQIVSASSSEVALQPDGGGQVLHLQLNDATAILLDGRAGSSIELRPGEEVRATYLTVDGQTRALRIEATSTPSPNQHHP